MKKEKKKRICPRCNNDDPAYFYRGSRGWYCRRCVSFKRVLLEEELSSKDYDVGIGVEDYSFGFPLTKKQEEAAERCREYLKEGDVLLKCVCGAGKTEISAASISSFLKEGKKVCYAIPRREVVKELAVRFQKIFSKAEVVAVYGGHHEKLTGDLIVCTVHQLYRYYRTFDLLVLDEVDAFPLSGNETLMNIALNTVKGHVLFSTATVNRDLQKALRKRKVKTVSLNRRPSGRPLPVPKLLLGPKPFLFLYLTVLLTRGRNPAIIFLPEKKKALLFCRLFERRFSCTCVTSDHPDRDRNILLFRNRERKYIFATTVLERGITIRGIDVILYVDRKNAFSSSSMVQMLGRVDRGIEDTGGRAWILSDGYSSEIRKTMNYLQEANA